MFGFSGWDIGWFCITCVVGAVMWATQVGPNEAASNLSEWAIRFGIHDPPAWLRARKTDRRVRMGATVALIGLIFWGGTLFEAWIQPTSQPGTQQPNKATVQDNPKIQTTQGIGTPPNPSATTIQWNQTFGITRGADRVFGLLLDGRGPESRSVKLKDAYLESGITGDIIKMQVGSENPLEDSYPISEANLIPRDGFIRLTAKMNPRDTPTGTQNGLTNKEFIERWRKIWFNAVYEEGDPERISFDMSGYFLEAGPHVTRKSDAKKE